MVSVRTFSGGDFRAELRSTLNFSILLNGSARNIPGGALKMRSRDTSQWIEHVSGFAASKIYRI